MSDLMSEYTLDARHLICPLPVIRLQDRIRDLNAGDRVKLLATDPGVKQDIPMWCRIHGHTVLSAEELADHYTFTIEVGSKT